MKFLTRDESHYWLESHNYSFEASSRITGNEGFVYWPSDGCLNIFRVPKDSWSQLLIANQLAKWFGSAEILLWITVWTTFDEGELELFEGFREAFGESRRLIDAPGLLLDRGQKADAWASLQILNFMMIFTWEGFVLREDKQCCIWMADEIIETWTLDASHSEDLKNALLDLGVSFVE